MTSLPIHGLHALAYCERLFYLENVEQLRVADERVYAGRRLHVELEREEDEEEWLTLDLESERWGLKGRIDCVRRRDGQIVPYEHKRGRSARGADGRPAAWPSDRVQIIAYAALVEEQTGREISEGRVRYHADNVLVHVPFDEAMRAELQGAIARARELQATVERPPVAENERLCVKCSLAPVCLPEEARLGVALTSDDSQLSGRTTLRLFPSDDDRRTLHVITQGARVGRNCLSSSRPRSSCRPHHAQSQPVLRLPPRRPRPSPSPSSL